MTIQSSCCLHINDTLTNNSQMQEHNLFVSLIIEHYEPTAADLQQICTISFFVQVDLMTLACNFSSQIHSNVQILNDWLKIIVHINYQLSKLTKHYYIMTFDINFKLNFLKFL